MSIPVQLAAKYREQIRTLVDNSFQFLVDNGDEDWINNLYPTLTVPDWEYIHGMVDQVMPIAHVIGVDGELPNVRNQIDFTSFAQSFSKLGLQYIWDETRLITLGRAMRATPDNTTALAQAMQMFFFNPQVKLVKAIADMARYQILQQLFTLNVEYEDPRTKAKISLDFRSLAPSELWPDDLTGASLWDQYTTATGLEDIQEHLRLYYAKNRRYPREIVMHWGLLSHLLRQDSTRTFMQNAMDISVINLGASTLPIQALAQLNRILSIDPLQNGQAFPVIKTYERVFPIQTSDTDTWIEYKEGVPLDRYAFIDDSPKDIYTPNGNNSQGIMGMGIYGPNIESAINMMSEGGEFDPAEILNRAQSEPYVWTSKINDTSVTTKAVANFIPIPADINSFAGRKVLA